ncbi:hypothetical protein MCUN1_002153 [Malassezia cuniculi]|uniref:ZZ-type domain-containing protein n=1 Tax=Malassezia cuniculi TaxID=948313 RepID=A0AAF0EYZ9_9BASI|nr:hypothetical protein MCUN1_002153 [Malassezia cuniculi]
MHHHTVSHVWRGSASSSKGTATAHACASPTLEGISSALRRVKDGKEAAYVYYTTNGGGLRHIHHFLPPRPDDVDIVAEAWDADDATYKLLTKPLWVLRRCAALQIDVQGSEALERWCSAHGLVIATTKALLVLVERLPIILAERLGDASDVPTVSYKRPNGSHGNDLMSDVAHCLQTGEPLAIVIGEAPGYTTWPCTASVPSARDLPLAPVALPSAQPTESPIGALAFAIHLPEAAHTLPPEAHTAPFEAQVQEEPEPAMDELESGFEEMLGHGRNTCRICDADIASKRLRCLTCPNWEACLGCAERLAEEHPDHKFVPLDAAVADAKPASWKEHPGVHCSRCSLAIVGPRFRCTICDDFDLCADCEALPVDTHAQSHGAHHILGKIDEPMDKRSWRESIFEEDQFAQESAAEETSVTSDPFTVVDDPFTDPGAAEVPFMLRGLSEAAALAQSAIQHPLIGRAVPIVGQALDFAAAVEDACSAPRMHHSQARMHSGPQSPPQSPHRGGRKGPTNMPLSQAIVQVVFAALPRPLGMLCDLDKLNEAVSQVVHSATNGPESSNIVEVDLDHVDAKFAMGMNDNDFTTHATDEKHAPFGFTPAAAPAGADGAQPMEPLD